MMIAVPRRCTLPLRTCIVCAFDDVAHFVCSLAKRTISYESDSIFSCISFIFLSHSLSLYVFPAVSVSVFGRVYVSASVPMNMNERDLHICL